MDHLLVKKAARKAEDLASAVEDHALRPAAFAVLFARLLDADAAIGDERSAKRRTPASTDKGLTANRGGSIGPIQRIRELAHEGFFKAPRSPKSTMEELEAHGHKYDRATVSKNLQRVVREKLLRRTRADEGGRLVYLHTEW